MNDKNTDQIFEIMKDVVYTTTENVKYIKQRSFVLNVQLCTYIKEQDIICENIGKDFIHKILDGLFSCNSWVSISSISNNIFDISDFNIQAKKKIYNYSCTPLDFKINYLDRNIITIINKFSSVYNGETIQSSTIFFCFENTCLFYVNYDKNTVGIIHLVEDNMNTKIVSYITHSCLLKIRDLILMLEPIKDEQTEMKLLL